MRLIPQNGGIKCVPQNGGAQTLLVEDLNQLGRRNLTRDQRDALIKRLAASGVPKSEIAGVVGLSRRRTQEIVQGAETAQAPAFTTPDLTVTAKLKDEIEALRRLVEAEKARAGKNLRSRRSSTGSFLRKLLPPSQPPGI